jgi:hypothetical protein
MIDETLEKALDVAIKHRDFEISHYWKRAAYFWAFITLTASGYFFLLENAFDVNIDCDAVDAKFACAMQYAFLYAISIAGIVLSFAWYFVNKGSKFWQDNWEMIIYKLENEIPSKLHQIYYDSEKNSHGCFLLRPKRYSVSKINLILSLFSVVFWIAVYVATALLFFKIKDGFIPTNVKWIIFILGLAVLLGFMCFLICGGRAKNSKGEQDKSEIEIKDILSEYSSSEGHKSTSNVKVEARNDESGNDSGNVDSNIQINISTKHNNN